MDRNDSREWKVFITFPQALVSIEPSWWPLQRLARKHYGQIGRWRHADYFARDAADGPFPLVCNEVLVQRCTDDAVAFTAEAIKLFEKFSATEPAEKALLARLGTDLMPYRIDLVVDNGHI